MTGDPAGGEQSVRAARARTSRPHGVDFVVARRGRRRTRPQRRRQEHAARGARRDARPHAGASIARPGRHRPANAGLARRTVRANVELALAWWGVPKRQRRARAATRSKMQGRAPGARPAARVGRRAAPRPPGPGRSGRAGRHAARRAVRRTRPALAHALRDDTTEALRDSASAVVVVLHERADAWAMADRIVIMFDGRIHADGPPQAARASADAGGRPLPRLRRPAGDRHRPPPDPAGARARAARRNDGGSGRAHHRHRGRATPPAAHRSRRALEHPPRH